MDGTIKALLRLIPAHDALEMGAEGTEGADLAVLVLVHGHGARLCLLIVSRRLLPQQTSTRRTGFNTPPDPGTRSSISVISDCRNLLYCALICKSCMTMLPADLTTLPTRFGL